MRVTNVTLDTTYMCNSSGFMFLNGVVDDHELLYPLQDGHTPLHWAAWGGHTACVEQLLSTPGIDVYIKDRVSWYTCRMGRVG